MRLIPLARALALVLLTLPGLAAASDVRMVVPYEGHLSFDGQPYFGEVDLRVSLGARWTEEHLGVRVAGGRFLVRLGSVVPIVDTLRLGATFDLSVAVRRPGEPAYVPLQGYNHRLTPHPVAMWSARTASQRPGMIGGNGYPVSATVTGNATLNTATLERIVRIVNQGAGRTTTDPTVRLAAPTTIESLEGPWIPPDGPAGPVALRLTGNTSVENIVRQDLGPGPFVDDGNRKFACGLTRFETPGGILDATWCQIASNPWTATQRIVGGPACRMQCVSGLYEP